MRRRKGETEKVSGNQVVRLSPKDKPTGQAGNQDIPEGQAYGAGRKSGTPDHPITRSPDHPITQFPDSKKAGFTILEAMIALVILSIALLALLRVMPVGIKGSKLAEETTIATMLAQRTIEEERAKGYPALANPDGTFGTPDNNFDWEINVIAGPTDTVREVSCSIYWPADSGTKGSRGKQRCVGIKTYIADY